MNESIPTPGQGHEEGTPTRAEAEAVFGAKWDKYLSAASDEELLMFGLTPEKLTPELRSEYEKIFELVKKGELKPSEITDVELREKIRDAVKYFQLKSWMIKDTKDQTVMEHIREKYSFLGDGDERK